MNDFDGRPLIAGEMVGIRSFRVDGLGRLTGVTQQDVWTPGVNEARCRSLGPLGLSFSQLFTTSFSVFGGAPVRPDPKPAVSTEKPQPHRVAQLGCGCGFWAYFDSGANPHHLKYERAVLGVIRGWGNVTAGSRGFRAEKAEVVALIKPRPRLDWATAAAYACFGFAALNIVIAAIVAILGQWQEGIFNAAAAIISSGSGYWSWTTRHEDRTTTDLRAVRRNYPAVPVYRSVRAALRAHPLTPPPPLTPDSDPEFWTRPGGDR